MKSIQFAVMLACMLMFLQACQKESMSKELPANETGLNEVSLTGEPSLRSFEPPDQQMVLGQKINNPYSVANMTTAWNNLYDPDYVALPATDLYVRFLPANLEELKLLFDYMDSLDIDLDDHPLDYEIIQEGTWYHDPSIPEDQPTWFYTVVKPDFVFPPIQYQVLEQLVLAPYYSLLTAEAFRITGNEYDDSGWERGAECHPDCPSYPCCYLPKIECWDDNRSCNGMPCEPGSSNWPDCLENPPPPPSGDPWVTTECGCKVSSNPLLPSGCVQVEDTQLGPEGVRNLKVVVKDGLFKRIVTETDENGCWHVSKAHGGRVKIKLKFKNDLAKIRAFRGHARFWQYAEILKHKVILDGPPYNNTHVLFEPNPDDDSIEKALWYAATGNNAIFEFHDYAASQNIVNTGGDIDVLLVKYEGAAAAPMFDELLNGTGGLTAGAIIAGLFQIPILGPPLAALSAFISIWAPDIVYAYGQEINRPSDRVKAIFYHEYAHAAHANKAGNSFWLELVTAEVQAGGHGDQNSQNADLISLVESWAEHIGSLCAHERYGNSTSYFPFTFATLLERTRNESENHVPIGLYYDLLDNDPDLSLACDIDDPNRCGIIDDQISDVSNTVMFSKMNSSTKSVQEFIALIKAEVSPQDQQKVEDLFNSY